MTEIIADYVTEQNPIDNDTEAAVKRHLLDWIGLVIGGHHVAESSSSVADGVLALTDAEHPAGVPDGSELDPDRAALLAGTYAHSLDFDDTHRASSLHPGAPVIAAALPVARERGVSGTRFLEAISVGYDVTCAVGRAVDPAAHYDRGFHLTATCGTFGATAAVAVLRDFDAETTEAAFGVNGSQAAGSLQFLDNGAWNKRLHPGLAADRALTAASLADSGFRGSTYPLTGDFGFLHGYTDAPHPEALSGIVPGAAIQETGLKPYPCCRYMHAAIDGLLELAGSVAVSDIESITLDLPSPGVRLTGDPIERKRRPGNFVDCQFSAPFAAALALTRGEAGLAAFRDAQSDLEDTELQALMDRVDVVSTNRTNDVFPEQWSAHIEIEGAEHHTLLVPHPRGEPERPLSDATIEAKLSELLSGTELAARQGAITDVVSSLQATDIDALIDVLSPT